MRSVCVVQSGSMSNNRGLTLQRLCASHLWYIYTLRSSSRWLLTETTAGFLHAPVCARVFYGILSLFRFSSRGCIASYRELLDDSTHFYDTAVDEYDSLLGIACSLVLCPSQIVFSTASRLKNIHLPARELQRLLNSRTTCFL